jgi:hypothetical protein
MHNFRLFIRWLFAALAVLAVPVAGRSEEAYQRFLEKLRDEKLFDLALVYLSELETDKNVSPEFKSQIALERGLMFYSAASLMSPKNAQRPAKLDKAEQAIRDFLQTRKQHPRRGEAQITLGNLLLTRAEEAKNAAGPETKEDIADAVKFYTEAHELFGETIKELAGILETMKGARTAANDTKQINYREQTYNEYQRAQLFSAMALENRGRSRVPKSPDWTKDLEAAAKLYSDMAVKETYNPIIKTYSVFYRSGVLEQLGKLDDAADGYQRVLDTEGLDSLRMRQTEAITRLIPILTTQNKLPVAIERGDRWDAQIRPDERQEPEVLEMRVALNRAKLLYIRELEKKDKNDKIASKLNRDVREQLRTLVRLPGAHQDEAKKLMSELGVEVAQPKATELPKVKNLGEAITAATDRIQNAESIDLKTLRAVLDDPNFSEAEKLTKTQELHTAEAAADDGFDQAIRILQDALLRHSKKADREQIFEARQKLAYSFYRHKQPFESIAVAEMLAFSSPRTESGLQAGAIALAGFGELLNSKDEQFKLEVSDTLEPFAEYLAMTWPDSEEASMAADALVKIALRNKQWAKAEQYLKIVPPGSTAAARLLRDAGLSFNRSYLDEKRQGTSSAEEIAASRKRAVEALSQAADSINKDAIGSAEVEVYNALAKIQLEEEQLDAAAKLVNSAILAVKADQDSISGRTALDSYKTALQVEIGRLAAGNVTGEMANKSIAEYIDAMEARSKKDADSVKLMEAIFVQLSRDTKELLAATKMPDRRKKLAEALIKVASEAGKKADGFSTRYWSAGTLLDLADQQKQEQTVAKLAAHEASNVLDSILTKSKEDAQWLPEGYDVNVRILLAKSQRFGGKFQEAIDSLGEILKKRSSMIDVQLEAAKTYQAWGDATSDLQYYKEAMEGGLPSDKGGKVIWGFGRIADKIVGKQNLVEHFFEARYELANTRFKYAKLSPADKKTSHLKQTVKDLESTAKLYPLSTSEKFSQFDALLKMVQKELGEEPVGLTK